MSLKSFVNSHKGRQILAVSALFLAAFGMAGGMVYFTISTFNSDKDTLEAAFNEAGSHWGITETKVEAEPESLSGLPSETLSFIDTDGSHPTRVESHPIGTALTAIERYNTEGLTNVQTSYTKPKGATGASGVEYDFKYYSGSVNDYRANGIFEKDARLFFELFDSSVNKVSFESKPSVGGGREYAINVQAGFNFDKTSLTKTQRLWNSLVNEIPSQLALENAIVNLSLRDSGKVTVQAVISDQSDVIEATAIDENRWSTFAIYAYESRLDYLNTERIEYSIENTTEDSTLRVITEPSTRDASNLRDRLIKYSIDSQNDYSTGQLQVIWSFNTYFIASDNPQPYLVFDSSSRNW